MSKTLTIFLVFILFCFSAIYGAPGKITGTVTDSETGEPLPGVNVVIEGTTMGASVNVEGRYFILNVPPGNYSVVASMVGYNKVVQREVRVSIDKTTEVDFQLTLTPIEGEEVVVIAPRLAVKRDVSQSEINATSEQIEIVPLVTDIAGYMSLQAGVELSGDIEDREFLIRGGGGTQIGMVVDGLTMTNNIGGGPIDIVNLSAIEEVSIIKGGFNAEYGNIRSGLFNVVTKDGGKSYNGSVDFRFTPAHLKHRGASLYDWENFWVRPYVDPAVAWVGTKNGSWDEYTQGQYREFEGWNAFTQRLNSDDDPSNDMTPEEARNLYIWQHALKGSADLGHPHEGSYGDKPDYNIDASLSGPIPLVGQYLGNLSFFASFRDNIEQYPYNSATEDAHTQNWMVKLGSKLSSTMKVGLEYISGLQEFAGGGEEAGVYGRAAYFPHVAAPIDINQTVYGFTFDHVVNPTTFYKIRASYVEVKNDQQGADIFRDTRILRSFGPVSVDEQPYGWLNDPGYVYAIADEQVIGGIGAESVNKSKVNTLNLKLDLTSQIDNYNELQGGLEFILDDYNILVAAKGFDPTGDFRNEWTNSPLRFQGYLQDKLEFEGFVANIGLRLDYNDPNTLWFGADPYSKYFSRVFKTVLESEAPAEDAKGHFRLSPRLGISHPISESSKLYFNYGHFYSMSNAFNMYEIDYGVASEGIASVGNPNLLPERTIAYELGYEHEIADLFLLRLTGYYRDITDEIGGVQYINYDESVSYNTFTNDHYADTRGFEIEVRKDWGDWITGWINYTLMVTQNGLFGREVQYQDPRLQAVYGARNPIVEKPLPMPYANANIRIMTPSEWGPTIGDYHFLDKLSLNFLVSWRAGEYLTWEPIAPFTQENNLQGVDRWNIDLRVSKFFQVDMFDVSLFVDINNVLDLKYLVGGFYNEADFRDYMNSLHLPIYSEDKYQNAGIYTAGDDQYGDVRSEDKPYINMPNMDFLAWNAPRSIVLGLRIGF